MHSLIRQLERARLLAERTGISFDELPLFHTSDGSEVDRHAAVATVFRLAELSGYPIRSAAGGYLYGGHSFSYRRGSHARQPGG